MSGKMSKIRMKSNYNFNKYNKDGSLRIDSMSKSQQQKYQRKKELESQRREEVERIKKSMGDEFTIEKNAYVDEEKNKIA